MNFTFSENGLYTLKNGKFFEKRVDIELFLFSFIPLILLTNNYSNLNLRKLFFKKIKNK